MAFRFARLPLGIQSEICCTVLLRQQLWSAHSIRACSAPSNQREQAAKPVAPPPKLVSTTSNSKTCQAKIVPDLTKSVPPLITSSDSQSNNPPKPTAPPLAFKQKLSPQNVRDNVRGYMFTRFFDYVKNYDKVLEKNFPSAVKVYRVFFDGVKDFYGDMKLYLKISRIANESPKGVRELNRKELELYMQMPRDMVKVAPALIFSSLPLVGYAIFPLVVMYPRQFLTTHFWTLQQRAQFQDMALQARLSTNRSVLRILQDKQNTVIEEKQFDELKQILGLLGSGFHPSVDQLLAVKDIFANPPLSLMSLSGKHVKLLCKMHGIPGGWFKRHRLKEHAFLVHYMDKAICQEGGIHNLPQEPMRYACFIRGLNPVSLSTEEMIEWLRNWIMISRRIREEHVSLFLHLPILLGYNHPNNWRLIYNEKSPQ